MTVILV